MLLEVPQRNCPAQGLHAEALEQATHASVPPSQGTVGPAGHVEAVTLQAGGWGPVECELTRARGQDRDSPCGSLERMAALFDLNQVSGAVDPADGDEGIEQRDPESVCSLSFLQWGCPHWSTETCAAAPVSGQALVPCLCRRWLVTFESVPGFKPRAEYCPREHCPDHTCLLTLRTATEMGRRSGSTPIMPGNKCFQLQETDREISPVEKRKCGLVVRARD